MKKLINNQYSGIRGFNYQPSYGSHGLEIWGDHFDIEVIRRELARGKQYFPKINTIRIWLSHDAFLRDSRSFPEKLEQVLEAGSRLGLQFIVTLFNGWHSWPAFGGITQLQVGEWVGVEPATDVFTPYLEAIIVPHQHDERILLWDLCNEPFNCVPDGKPTDDLVNWLKAMYAKCKELGAQAPLCVGAVPKIENLRVLNPMSDVLTFHPYYAWNMWVETREEYEANLDEAVEFANAVNKPILATETGWGSMEDKHRSEILEVELEGLVKREIGFTAHILHHTLVADGHRPQYGPISTANYMAFIEADGSLRPYHDIFNRF